MKLTWIIFNVVYLALKQQEVHIFLIDVEDHAYMLICHLLGSYSPFHYVKYWVNWFLFLPALPQYQLIALMISLKLLFLFFAWIPNYFRCSDQQINLLIVLRIVWTGWYQSQNIFNYNILVHSNLDPQKGNRLRQMLLEAFVLKEFRQVQRLVYQHNVNIKQLNSF